MSASTDQAYRRPAGSGASAGTRLRYDPTRPVDVSLHRAAERHSARVRRLKIILPVLAVVGAGIFWGGIHFIPSDLASIAKGAGIDVTSNSVVMNRPHISGFEGTRRAYDVQAESAVQSLSDPKVVTFNKIDASIGLDGNGTANLNAATGIYDGNRNTLNLKNGIAIETDIGYAASASDAAIDLGQGSLVSNSPIEIITAQGTIRANAIAVSDRGKHIVFSNGVSVSFLPPGSLAAAPTGN